MNDLSKLLLPGLLVVFAGCSGGEQATSESASTDAAKPVAEEAVTATEETATEAAGEAAAERVVDEAQTWNLAALYSTVDDWEAAKATISAALDKVVECKGHLGRDAATLKTCLDNYFEGVKEFNRYYSYAAMGSDENLRNQDAMARRQTAGQFATRLSTDTSFVQPELLKIGEEQLRKFLDEEPGLAIYRFYLENVLREAPHTLGNEGENVIAATGDMAQAPYNIYSTLTGAEIDWPTVTLSDGTEARLDQAGYSKYRSVANREDRIKVFSEFWGKWREYERTLGAVLNSRVGTDYFNANVRDYENSLQSALSGDNVPEEVYRTLVKETNANLDTLHRYFRLRARMLGIEDLRYHDIYPPLVNLDKTFPIEDGKDLVVTAVQPLGSEYVGAVEEGFANRWMDTYPQEGKRSGAYMNGSAYDVHPFVLMNYNDDYESVSTLAHEWGHAIHSYLASKEQPFATSDYATFTAEIASTFNEALLLRHMLEVAADDEERLYYLGSALEGIRGTFFRQTMFAEFELAIHELVENGEPLTGQKLTQLYGDILRRYHGHDDGVLTIDDAYTIEWAYIPHFYYNFYVYQYATSIAAASLLAEDVLEGGEDALDRYLDLLKAGGSDYPYELLKRAGVDLATPEPYRATFARMNAIMDQIEAILDRQETGEQRTAGL